MALLNVNDLKKVYTTRLGGAKVQALAGVSFTVGRGGVCGHYGRIGLGQDHPSSTFWRGWISPPAARCS